jgi:4-hydroxy-3-polyprenylbenzoate decarboxylase
MPKMTPQKVTGLRDFIALLEARGHLSRVSVPVEAHLEIAAITDRVCKGAGGGRALLFEQVRGFALPVAINLFGSLPRAAWATGSETPALVAARFAAALARESGPTTEVRLRRLLARPRYRPLVRSGAPWQEVRGGPCDLSRLPALRAWPGDGGRYLTLALVFTRDPDSGAGNCGLYRVQLFADGNAAVHWRPGSDAARQCAAWHGRGRPMPVAIALGGDPVLPFAAAFPLPPDADELALAAVLRGRPQAVTPARHSDLTVPVAAEIVIEGLVYPGETRPEGPFGNHSGFYRPVTAAPLLRVTALSYRRGAILPATLVGPPPMEDCWLAKLAEGLLLALLRIDFPCIVTLNLLPEGISHGAALLAVRPGTRGRELIRALWAHGPLRTSRLLLVVEAGDVPLEPAACFWRALNRAVPERDLLMDGGRLGIDATVATTATALRPDAATAGRVRRRWTEYGIEPLT